MSADGSESSRRSNNDPLLLGIALALRQIAEGLAQIAEVLEGEKAPAASEPSGPKPCAHPPQHRIRTTNLATPAGIETFGCCVCDAEFSLPAGEA